MRILARTCQNIKNIKPHSRRAIFLLDLKPPWLVSWQPHWTLQVVLVQIWAWWDVATPRSWRGRSRWYRDFVEHGTVSCASGSQLEGYCGDQFWLRMKKQCQVSPVFFEATNNHQDIFSAVLQKASPHARWTITNCARRISGSRPCQSCPNNPDSSTIHSRQIPKQIPGLILNEYDHSLGPFSSQSRHIHDKIWVLLTNFGIMSCHLVSKT